MDIGRSGTATDLKHCHGDRTGKARGGKYKNKKRQGDEKTSQKRLTKNKKANHTYDEARDTRPWGSALGSFTHPKLRARQGF